MTTRKQATHRSARPGLRASAHTEAPSEAWTALERFLEVGRVPLDAAPMWHYAPSYGNALVSVRVSKLNPLAGQCLMPHRGLYAEVDFEVDDLVTVYGSRLVAAEAMKLSLEEDRDGEAALRKCYLLHAKETHGSYIFDGWHAARRVSWRPGADGCFEPDDERYLFRGLGSLAQHAGNGEANVRLGYAPLGDGRFALLPPVPHLVATRPIRKGEEVRFDYRSGTARPEAMAAEVQAQEAAAGAWIAAMQAAPAPAPAAASPLTDAAPRPLLLCGPAPAAAEDVEVVGDEEVPAVPAGGAAGQEQDEDKKEEDEDDDEDEDEDYEERVLDAEAVSGPAYKLTSLPADPELLGWTIVEHKNRSSGRKWKVYHGPAGETAKSRVSALAMACGGERPAPPEPAEPAAEHASSAEACCHSGVGGGRCRPPAAPPAGAEEEEEEEEVEEEAAAVEEEAAEVEEEAAGVEEEEDRVPAFAEAGGERLHAVERLLAERRTANQHGSRTQFKVRWAGFSAADDSWEDEENILDVALIRNLRHAEAAGGGAPSGAAAAPAGKRKRTARRRPPASAAVEAPPPAAGPPPPRRRAPPSFDDLDVADPKVAKQLKLLGSGVHAQGCAKSSMPPILISQGF